MFSVSNEQRTELATWAGTDIIDYDLHNVPSHISRLETQAWRPGVIKVNFLSSPLFF
jgi:hypothetical protein